MKNWKRTLKCSLSLTVLTAILAPNFAFAQSASTDDGSGDTIVVTGSRIPRPDMVANSPLQVIDGEEFQLTTRLEVDELLNHVPSVSVPNGATTNSEGNGRAAVSLRNLGTARTLVLINGRRVVGSSTSGTVDINSISPALIDRIDVVTGGASAVYGSDAMAGVVNFILKDDFEGLAVDTQYGITERGDGQRYGLDLTFGANSADGRGNLIVNAGYLNRDSILAGEREFSAYALDESDSNSTCATNVSGPGADLGLSTTAPCLRVGGSSRIPGSYFRVRGTPEDLAGNPIRPTDPSGTAVSGGRFTFNDDGSIRVYSSATDRFNFNPYVNLLLPLERHTLSTAGHYDVTDRITLFGEASYTNSTLNWRQAPFAADVEDRPGQSDLDVQFSINSPFIDAATRSYLSAWDDGGVGAGPDGILGTADDTSTGTRDLIAGDNIINVRSLRRRPLEAGPRNHFNLRNTYRFVAGLRGELGQSMNWEVYYNFGRHERTVINDGRFSETRARQGVLLNAAGDACADTSNGCVPLNFFGPNTMTQDQLDFVTYQANSRTIIEQEQIGASFSGEFGGLSAGPIGYSVGGEWRSQSADFRPDYAAIDLEAAEPIAGKFSVTEAFGELYVPLVSGHALAEYLALEMGMRVSDYDNSAGTVYTYKFGGEWVPVSSLKVRAMYQEATRAPNINELFSPINGAAEEATDMCQGTPGSVRNTNAAIDAYCDAQGVPDDYEQDNNQINIRTGGNPNLESETSETWTFGFVLTPESMPGLTLSADYYDINIEGGISQFGGGLAGTFAGCSADPRVGNPFCDALVRNADGEIDAFHTVLGNANASLLGTSGIDFAARYAVELPDARGQLAVSFNGTYVIDDIFAASVNSAENDCVGLVSTRGLCGEGVPQFQSTTDITHRLNKLTTRLRYRYVGEIGSELVAFDAANGIDRQDAFTTVDAEHYFDAFLAYDFSEQYSVNFSVRNLLDNQPPIIGDAGGEPNIDSQLHDPLGRRYTVAFHARF